MAEHLNENNFDRKVLEREGLSLVEFYSETCVPCKIMEPVMAELEEDYGENVLVGTVNVTEAPELSRRFGVMASPTFLLFKKGAIAEKIIGVIPKRQLEEHIHSNL